MTLLNAPAYDARRETRTRNILIAAAIFVVLFAVLFVAGRLSGHGWLFTDLRAEHRVSTFFDALQEKDYAKAYGIYYNDSKWSEHPQQYSYTL